MIEEKPTKLSNFLQSMQAITKKDLVFTVIILVLLFIIGFMSWSSDKNQTEDIPGSISVPIPGVKSGSETIYMPIPVTKDTTIYKENPVNKELVKSFLIAADSIEKLNLYIQAITENDYKLNFKDGYQDVTVNSKVRGQLLSQNINYEIFPREVKVDTVFKVEVQQKRQLFALVELGAPIRIKQNKFVGKATVIFKNKKHQIFSTSIDTDANVWMGAGIKL